MVPDLLVVDLDQYNNTCKKSSVKRKGHEEVNQRIKQKNRCLNKFARYFGLTFFLSHLNSYVATVIKAREVHLIHKENTSSPLGINRRDEAR